MTRMLQALLKNPLFRFSLVILWMMVIFAFSHQANSGRMTEAVLGPINVPVRKLGHLGEYMVLYVLIHWALDSIKYSIIKHRPALAYIFSVFYAASDEWHQNFVPGRSASTRDVVIDSAGAFIGVFVYLLLEKFFSKDKKKNA